MATTNRDNQHAEHLHEMRDLVQWLQDLDRWHADIGEIADMLTSVKAAVLSRRSALDNFSCRIRTVERKVLDREEALDELEGESQQKSSEEENNLRLQYAELREQHGIYRKLHQTVLEKTKELHGIATSHF